MTYKPQSKLKDIREYMGISKTSIAKKINKSIQTYTAKEDGKKLFNLDEIFIITNLLGRNVEDVFINPIQK